MRRRSSKETEEEQKEGTPPVTPQSTNLHNTLSPTASHTLSSNALSVRRQLFQGNNASHHVPESETVPGIDCNSFYKFKKFLDGKRMRNTAYCLSSLFQH